MSHENLPGWTVIRTAEDLEEHDPADPAYLLVPPRLVPMVGDWLLSLDEPGPKGDRCRRIEGLFSRLAADPASPHDHMRSLSNGNDDNGLPVPGEEASFSAGDSEDPDEDDDDPIFEEGDHDPPLAAGGVKEGDSAGLEELWHDFSDELIRTGIVDSE